MQHLAILRKAKFKRGDNLLQDIVTGKKTIESRWYKNRNAPWNRIQQGDMIFFKESGCAVTARGRISKVLQFENLTPAKTETILLTYGKKIASDAPIEKLLTWGRDLKNKNYCILIFLEDIEPINPQRFDKSGFGISSAWICSENLTHRMMDMQ